MMSFGEFGLQFLLFANICQSTRNVRYTEFRPPIIISESGMGDKQVTLTARQNLNITCLGHKPVRWHVPRDPDGNVPSNLASRLSERQAGDPGAGYSATLSIQHLVYTDTGRYLCSFVDSQDLEAAEATDHLYIYVFDSKNLLVHSGFDFIQSVAYKSAEIPCRPTHPNVSVSLTLAGRGAINPDNNQYVKYDPQVGFIFNPALPKQSGQYSCSAKYGGRSNEYGINLNVLMQTTFVPPPTIERTSGSHISIGESLEMTCSVSVSWSVMVRLSWDRPNPSALPPRLILPDPVSKNVSVGGTHLKVVEQKLILRNVNKEDQGTYACLVMDHSDNQKHRKEFVRVYGKDQSFLRVWHDGYSSLHRSTGEEGEVVQWVVEISSHPAPTITWYDPEGDIMEEGEDEERGRTVQTVRGKKVRSMLRLSDISLEDSGNYVIKVNNGDQQKSVTFTLQVTENPKIHLTILERTETGLYQHGDHLTLRCVGTGYPAPELKWSFRSCQSYEECDGNTVSLQATKQSIGRVQTESVLSVVAANSGLYTCMGCNGECVMNQTKLFVTTLPDGFHVQGPSKAVEGDVVELVCAASKYNYTDNSLVWYKQTGSEYVRVADNAEIIDVNPSKFDVGKRLRFASVRPEDSGVYACRAVIRGPMSKRHDLIDHGDETIVERQMELTVDRMEIPQFVDTTNMNNGVLYVKNDGETVEMKCMVRGVPTPEVTWYLNNTALDLATNLNYQTFDRGQSLRISTVVSQKNEGTYTCRASSRAGEAHLDQTIVKVEAPRIYETNMAGSHQIIDSDFNLSVLPGQGFNLTCRAHGKPRPVITWMLDRKLINKSHVVLGDNRQTLMLSNAGAGDQGRYECIASNIGGSVTRYQLVKLSSEDHQAASILNSKLALPIYIAVGAVLLIAITVLIGIKFCCKRNIKSPATPPTPRLTQYEQPDDTESCHLTREHRDTVSPSPCQGCHQHQHGCHQQQYNSLYSCSLSQLPLPTSPEPGIPSSIMGSSLIGVRSCYSPSANYAHPNYHHHNKFAPRIPSPGIGIPSPMSDFTAYGGMSQSNLASSYSSHYNHNTLPLRMETLNREITKRLQERQLEASTPPSVEF